MSSSVGLSMQVKRDAPLASTIEIVVGHNQPFSSTRQQLRVLADTLSKDHQVTIHCPWAQKPLVVTLNFSPPLAPIWRLHTVEARKFIQITVTGRCDRDLPTQDAQLKISGSECTVISKNCESSQVRYHLFFSSIIFHSKNFQMISNGLSYCFMWELLAKDVSENLPTLKTEFSIKYKLDVNDIDNKLFQYFFEINDYQVSEFFII